MHQHQMPSLQQEMQNEMRGVSKQKSQIKTHPSGILSFDISLDTLVMIICHQAFSSNS